MLLTSPQWSNITTPPMLSADRRASASDSLERHLSSQSADSGRSSTPDGRGRGLSKQRSSFFALRTKSSTIGASSTSAQSRASSTSGLERPSRRPSEGYVADSEASAMASETLKNTPLLGRKRSSTRQNTKLGFRQTLDWTLDRAYTASYPAENREQSGQSSSTRNSAYHEKRCNISAPFDFHHLTHTQRRQLPALNKSSVADLAAEFQAVQESQLPRKELDGIRVKDLHFASFSSEVLVQDQSEDVNSSFARVLSPPPSPLQSFHPIGQTSSPSTHSSRHTRSIDSLASSEHKTSSRKSSIPPITPPPRTLSQAVLTRLSDLSVLHMPTSVSSSRCSSRRESRSRDSSLWSHTGEAAATPETTCSTASDPFATNHNGTTIPALISRATSPFPNTGGLENVPEEPEGHHSQRLGAGLVALGSPLRHARSFPVSALARNDPSLPAPSASRTNVRLRPKASDTLGTPIKTPSRKSSPRRISRAFKLLESSWEDDVEYCYELAAEADCDFDWDNTSRSGCDDSEGDLPSTTHKQDFAESPSFNRGTVLQARREKEVAESDGSPLSNTLHEQISSPDSVSNRESVPELDRQSAHSTSTVGTGVFTPDVFSSAAPPVGYEVFKARPLPAVPQTPHREVTRLNVYDDLLDDYVTAIQLRPSLEGDRDVSALARPSLTKSSSHDSRLGGASFTSAKGIQRPISSASNIAVRVQEHRSQPVLNRAIIASVEEATSRAQQNQGASIGEAPLWARKTLEAMPLWARDTPSPTVPAVITTSSSASSSFEDLSTRKRIDLSARLSKPLPPTPPQSPTSERSVNPLGQARPKRARQRTHTLSLFPAPLRVRRS